MVRFAIISLLACLCAVGTARGLLNLSAGASPAPAPQVAMVTDPAPSAVDTGDASIAKSSDDEYWADAEVNGQQVHLLVDTGASFVSLTPSDARRLGFNPDGLVYDQPVSTANGQSLAARVKLNVVTVGRAEVSAVDALVIPRGLPTSLLGMSFLHRLTSYEFTRDALVLRA